MLDSTEYIEPADRPAAWAAMARQYAAHGWTRHDIAWALCVDEPTVDRLLDVEATAHHDARNRYRHCSTRAGLRGGDRRAGRTCCAGAPRSVTTRAARAWRPDGPGSFQAPAGVRAVQDRHGRLWTRGTTRWTCTGTQWIRWRVLVAEHGPVTEAPAP